MVSSGDLRRNGAVGAPSAKLASAGTRRIAVSFCIVMVVSFSAGHCSATKSRDLLPFVNDPLHFCCRRGGGIFRTPFTFEDRRNHFGNQRAVKNFHVRRRRGSGNA